VYVGHVGTSFAWGFGGHSGERLLFRVALGDRPGPRPSGGGQRHHGFIIKNKYSAGKQNLSDDLDLRLSQIGLRIVKRRQELGISQKDLAERLGVAQANLARIEYGRQNLTLRSLLRLAEALDMTADELFSGTVPRGR
jgi:DNA-binding XRE family transcriptional regulator